MPANDYRFVTTWTVQVRLLTKGKLPYTLKWQFEVVDVRHPHGFTIEADGDFEGAASRLIARWRRSASTGGTTCR